MPTRIILVGEGGQGVQSVGEIIAKAAQKSGKFATYLPSFGVEQRGGVSKVFLQISSKPIPYPRFSQAELVVAFSNRSVEQAKNFIFFNSLFIYDSSAIEDSYLKKIKEPVNFLKVPAEQIARQNYIPKVANMIILGAILAHLKEIPYQQFEKTVLEEFADKIVKNPKIKDLNLGALKEGLDWAEKFDQKKEEFKGTEPKNIQKIFFKVDVLWQIFPEYCKGCGLCLVRCPVAALKFSAETCFLGNPLPIVDIQKCIGCLKCMKICPDGAIKVEKKVKSP